MHDPEDRKKTAGLNSVFCTSFREELLKTQEILVLRLLKVRKDFKVFRTGRE